MSKTVINIKADKEVKKRAQELARELGLPLSTVINAYLKDFIRNKEVHLSVAHQMSQKLERLLARVEEDIRKKRNISSAFSSVEEMDEYLDSL